MKNIFNLQYVNNELYEELIKKNNENMNLIYENNKLLKVVEIINNNIEIILKKDKRYNYILQKLKKEILRVLLVYSKEKIINLFINDKLY